MLQWSMCPRTALEHYRMYAYTYAVCLLYITVCVLLNLLYMYGCALDYNTNVHAHTLQWVLTYA